MFCSNCGHQNADGAKFCAGCGGQLTTNAPIESASHAVNPNAYTPNAAQPPKKINVLSLISLFFGIVSVIFMPPMYIVPAIIAILAGAAGINLAPKYYSGKGKVASNVGIIVACINVLLNLFL